MSNAVNRSGLGEVPQQSGESLEEEKTMHIGNSTIITAKYTSFVREEKTDAVRKIAADHGGKPVKNGYRFTAKTKTEVNEQVNGFIAELPPLE
jgi:hypothetical protein